MKKRWMQSCACLMCLLLLAACTGDATEDKEDEPLAEVAPEPVERVLEVGSLVRLDAADENQQHEILVRRGQVGIELVWDQKTFALEEADKERVQDRARLFEGDKGLMLALYQDESPEASQILFYGLGADGTPNYLGHIRADQDLFSAGPVRLEGSEALLAGQRYALDARVPQAAKPAEPKDAFLDYLGLPAYSLASGLGDADATEAEGGKTRLVYAARDTVVMVADDRIGRVCTTSGSLLGLDIGANIDEAPDEWKKIADSKRFEEGIDASETEDLVRYGFDVERFYVECLVQRTESGRVIRELCVELSELYAAEIEDDKVLVDRFGDLLYRGPQAGWTPLVEADDGYADMELIGFEQENGAVFFLAGRGELKAAFFYQLEEDVVRELAQDVRAARMEGGVLTVEIEGGERRYFDQGGTDVTAELTGQSEEPQPVEFYVSEDTLYYLPAEPDRYVIIPSLGDVLAGASEATVETYHDARHDIGLVHVLTEPANGVGALYLFRPDTAQFVLLADRAARFGLVFPEPAAEPLILVAHADDSPSAHEVFTLTGISRGASDEAGNPLTEGD